MSDLFQESRAHAFTESRAHQRILARPGTGPESDVGKTWHAAADHLCSGFAPFFYSARGSESWSPEPSTEEEVAANQWVTGVYHALYNLGPETTPDYDFRDTATRYLVLTWTWTISSIPGSSTVHKLAHIQKYHQHTNVLRYEAWKESFNGGSTWTTLSEWSLSDAGALTTSGSFSLSANDWMAQYYTAPAGSDGPYWTSGSAAITASSETFSAHCAYYDGGVAIYGYDIAADFTLSNEDAIPWSVGFATAACFALTERVKLIPGNVGYYDNSNAWQTLDPDGENVSVYWQGPSVGTALAIIFERGGTLPPGLAAAPFDGSDNFPDVVGTDCPVAAKWLNTAAAQAPGFVSMEKTLLTVPAGTYETVKKSENLSAPESVSGPGHDWSTGPSSASDVTYGAPARLYYSVPTGWQSFELLHIPSPA